MKTFLIIVLSSCGFMALGTAQIPDKIYYQGKEFALYTTPLESYFTKNPGKRPKHGIPTTALRRGYVATFEFVDNQLVLKDIEVQEYAQRENVRFVWRSVINEVFPDGPGVKMDWFSGLLVLPYGTSLKHLPMRYGSEYDHYFILEVNAGNFVRAKNFTSKQYTIFKEKQFGEFKRTMEYQAAVAEINKDKDFSKKFVDDIIKKYIIDYSGKILVDDQEK